MRVTRNLSHFLFGSILILSLGILFFTILFLSKVYPNLVMGLTSLLVAIKLNNIGHLFGEGSFYLNFTLSVLALVLISSLVIGIIRFLVLKAKTKKFVKLNLNKKKILSKKLRNTIKELNISRVDEIKSKRLEIFCFGFIKPRICISSSLVEKLTSSELKAVLLHERGHLKNYDPVKILILKTLTILLFFIVGLKTLVKKYFLASEILADENAIQYFKSKKYLIKALIKIFRSSNSLKKYPEAVGALNVTEERIKWLVGEEKNPFPFKNSLVKFIFSSSVVLAIMIFLALGLSFASCGHPMKCLTAVAQATPSDIGNFSQVHEVIDSGVSCNLDYLCPEKLQSTNIDLCTNV